MSTKFPTAVDDGTSLPDPSAGNNTNSPSHASLHDNTNGAIKAIETKLGTGSSTPAANTILFGTGSGTSAFQTLTSAQLLATITDETGTGSLVFATTPTLVTPKVDTINESTPSNGVTVGGVNLKTGVVTGSLTGVLNSANAVATSNITDAAVTPAKLLAGTGSSWAWQSWTPTLANLTLGNGTVIAKYTQIGKTIHGFFRFTMGSTSAMGTGPTFTLPAATQTSTFSATLSNQIGTVWIDDTGIGNFQGPLIITSSSTVASAFLYTTTGTYAIAGGINSTAPMTWGSTDTFNCSFTYEAA